MFDGRGGCSKITESAGGTSIKQFVWSGDEMCEARNAAGLATAQYFTGGESISGANFYFTRDQLGSVREMTNNSASIQFQSSYDPYGRTFRLVAINAPDFQFCGYYAHNPTGLNLTFYRAYSSNAGRWLNRDPLEDQQTGNFYPYVENDPINRLDPMGLSCVSCLTTGAVSPVRNPGRPAPPPPPPGRRKDYCLSEGCCWNERRGCLYECYRKAINEGKPPCWLDHCKNCCKETYAWCNEVVTIGQRFYGYKFDDCWAD